MTDEPQNGPPLPYGCRWISYDTDNESYVIRLQDGRQGYFNAEWRAIKWAQQESQ